MRFIILDLEATCTDNRNIYFDNEVIEIGAVKIENKLVIDEFQSFVKPIVNTELTEFCKNLTSINQSDGLKGSIIYDSETNTIKHIDDDIKL